jgi:hypothetical protein
MRPAVMLLAFLLIAHTSLTGLAAREEITREASQLQTTPATGSQPNGTCGQLNSVEVKIPAGTSVEIEAAYDISSAYVEEGDAISFRAVGPVKVDGVTVIAPSALATALVVRAKQRGHWGRSGRLAWSMRDIVAVDGQRIALRFEREAAGEGKRGEVATKTLVTGALLWPVFPIAPVALLWGFKKGKHAVIPAGKRFVTFVNTDAVVSVPEIRSD